MKLTDLKAWPWEWMVTLTFRSPVSNATARMMLLDWSRSVAKQEHLQIAYIGVLNYRTRSHLHLLALGRNRHGLSLKSADIPGCQKLWKGGLADIQSIYDLHGACAYFICNMPFLNNDTLYYNNKLLSKTQY